jgi:excisionase family DNA binding protein
MNTNRIEITRLMNAQEVADTLSIAKSTAYLLIQRKEIPSVRVGRAVRVRPEDLEEYIKQNLVGYFE